MRQSEYANPTWWSQENETAWNRVKMAMKRDWDQTKHDLGANQPDTNQKIGNTTRQASGKEPIPPRGEPAYEELEPMHRFGYGAYSRYGHEFSEWDDELESRLKGEWEIIAPSRRQTWMQDRAAIRYGWKYGAEDLVEADNR